MHFLIFYHEPRTLCVDVFTFPAYISVRLLAMSNSLICTSYDIIVRRKHINVSCFGEFTVGCNDIFEQQCYLCQGNEVPGFVYFLRANVRLSVINIVIASPLNWHCRCSRCY